MLEKPSAKDLEELLAVLSRLETRSPDFPDLGTAEAGIYPLDGGGWLVQSGALAAPFLHDLYLFGRILAAHALNNIYAVGAQPLLASTFLFWRRATAGAEPGSTPGQSWESSQEVYRGVLETLAQAGVKLGGGQTIEADFFSFGLAVSGFSAGPRILTRRGARVGDQLVLTKPIGTGVVLEAFRRGKAGLEELQEAVKLMTELNREAALVAVEVGATASTDVGGYGLLGHLAELARFSGVGIKLRVDKVPVLRPAWRLVDEKVFSQATYHNHEHFLPTFEFDLAIPLEQQLLLVDATWAGGLLLTVPREKVTLCLKRLEQSGVEGAAVIGEAIAEPDHRVCVLP